MKYNLFILLLISLNLTQIYSQLKDSKNLDSAAVRNERLYLNNCENLAGPVIGYSLKSAVITYGVNYERAFAQNNSGIFTAGVMGKFNTHKEELSGNQGELKTQNILMGLQGNFHLNKLSSPTVIPFIGILLGYNYSTTEYIYINNINNSLFPDTKKHSFYIYGQAGIRFFFSKNAAFSFRGGTGNIDKGIIEAGIDLKF